MAGTAFWLVLIASWGCRPVQPTGAGPIPEGREARVAFFHDFVAKTVLRTAFSPPKWRALGTDYRTWVEGSGLREEFAQAETTDALWHAVHRLNHSRRDRHLRVRGPVPPLRCIPVRFYPDLQDDNAPSFFVANLDASAQTQGVERGDQLVAVDGIPVADVVERLWWEAPYSSPLNFYVRGLGNGGPYPGLLSCAVGPAGHEGPDVARLTLRNAKGEREVALPRTPPRPVEWMYEPLFPGRRSTHADIWRRRYLNLGLKAIAENRDATLYVDHDRRLAVLEWVALSDVERTLPEIVDAAERANVLDYGLVLDLTHGRGGSRSEQVVAAMADAPFKTTFGNVRVDDVAFARAHLDQHSRAVRSWIRQALAQGASFTTNEPFKLRHFPRGSDGMMQPARRRFTGRKVALFFPWGGSNLDQFAAMIVDNPQLGIHSMGMSPGGYSNTWEWSESLDVPGLGPVVFSWTVGHTIRPNGEVLEGNPARAVDWRPLTQDNASTYLISLLEAGMAYVER
ncbi:MAG: hypothetical protein AAGA48_24805 [Myxococcota bacterium]